MDLPIGEGTRVYLNFSLNLEDGSVIDSNFEDDPVDFAVGDGSLLPSFERLLFGLCSGQSQAFTVLPEDAFGMPNPNNIQEIGLSDFDEEIVLEVGLVVSFADASGSELPGVISEIQSDCVLVDFNHPLAGKCILFNVEIHKVEAAELH